MKLRGALLLVVAATVCALSGLISPQEAAASVDAVNQWPAKPTIVSNSNTAAVSGSFTVAPGTKRLMLVAVAIESTTAPTVAVSYGGQALTQIVLNTTGANKLWVGRLNEAGIVAAGANKTLSATLTGAGTITATYVTAAVYAGVDQTTPVIGSGSLGTTVTALTIGPVGYTPSVSAINGNNGLSVYLVNWNNTNVGQTTPATGFTEVRDYIGTNFSLSANYKVTTGAAAESITSTTTTSAIAALAAVTLNPAAGAGALSVATVTTCGDCHGYPPQDGPYTSRNVPPGQFIGAHSKHSGTDEGQYAFVCTECHYNNGSNLKHENAYKDISGSRVPRNTYGGATNIAMTNSPTFTQTCTKSTCHSTGRTVRQYAASPTWNSTTTCLSCHGGRSSSTNLASRSANNFSMSTSHSQHLKYLYTEINCNTCHGKIAASHTALKDYSGAIYHGNGTKNVYFTDIAYGSYTSYKTGTKKCSNTACHGGTSRNAWSESAGLNNDNTCVHCHGAATTTPADTNKKKFAPGWGTGANKGISTDNYTSAKNFRVGAHFVHLSSVFMKQIKCNECHTVPSKPFEGTHMTGTRYNSQTLTFAQASTARILIGVAAAGTPSHLSAFAGYTSGTATKAATCSSVYCHGNRLKTGDTTGTDRKPAWNRDDLTSNTPGLVVCGRCHGNPPGAPHTAATPTTGCGGCHGEVVNATGVIINKGKHIDGRVQGGGHAYPYGGSVHMPGGTGAPVANAAAPYTNCNGCHTNISAGGGYPVATGNAVLITCGNCHINYTNFSGATPGCWDCHGSSATNGMPNSTGFPNLAGSHDKHVNGQGMACVTCHTGGGTGTTNHGSAGGVMSSLGRVTVAPSAGQFSFSWAGGTGKGTCSSVACHGTAEWGVTTFNCVTCHNGAIAITKGPLAGSNSRRNVSAEFMSTWSHFRSLKGGTITTVGSIPPAACIVCHMEGNPATGGQMASYHGNGYVELRDPDTGVTIKNVNWVSAAGAGNGWYTNATSDMNTMAAFRRNLASSTLEPEVAATQINFCLKCHDSNGALSTLSRLGGAAAPALRPFNIAIRDWTTTSAMSSLGNPTGSGNVVDAKHSFLTSNAAYHPIMGKGNNGYAKGLRMAAPWNGIAQTMGTNTNWGYLISCWDCHAPSAATGMQTFSVTAHGAPATLRGLIRGGTLGTTATNNLCFNCHLGYAGNSNHLVAGFGTSAFQSGGSSMGGSMKSCHYCHGSGIGVSSVAVAGSATLTEALARPLRAEDVHGFENRLPQVAGSKWASGNRPYAFIRNTLTGWRPARSPETAANTTGNCTGISGRTCDSNMGGRTYAPGGVY